MRQGNFRRCDHMVEFAPNVGGMHPVAPAKVAKIVWTAMSHRIRHASYVVSRYILTLR